MTYSRCVWQQDLRYVHESERVEGREGDREQLQIYCSHRRVCPVWEAMWGSAALPWAPTAADTSALSVSCSLSLFTHLPSISTLFFLPAPLYCISLVSRSWPFAIVLCQIGIWNQLFFISPDLLSLSSHAPSFLLLNAFPLSAPLLFTFILDYFLELDPLYLSNLHTGGCICLSFFLKAN